MRWQPEELIGEAISALKQLDEGLLNFNSAIARLTEEPHKLGEFVHLSTHGRMLHDKLDDLKERWTIASREFGLRRLGRIMKITKQRLKEIIREELSSLDEKNYYQGRTQPGRPSVGRKVHRRHTRRANAYAY